MRNCADAVASLNRPLHGAGLKLLPVPADDAHSDCIASVLPALATTHWLFRGAEGDAYADPPARPERSILHDGAHEDLFEAERCRFFRAGLRAPGCRSMPMRRARALILGCAIGEEPSGPRRSRNRLACCRVGAGYKNNTKTDDFNQRRQ